MKLPKARIEVACATDTDRPQLTMPFFHADAKEPCLVATDGKILAISPMKGSKPERGYLPIAALKEARKSARRWEEIELSVIGNTIHCKNEVTFPRVTDKDVGYENVPAYAQIIEKAQTSPKVVRIGLNAKLLARLATALNSEVLCLEIADTKQAIVVTPTENKEGQYGLIMPYFVANKDTHAK